MTSKSKVDTSSSEFKEKAIQLYKKVGYTVMDAKKALYWAEGDMEKAEEILKETEGFRSSKLITYR